jgi:hypothetical protein
LLTTCIDLADKGKPAEAVNAVRAWIAANVPGGILNVAGPRANKHPEVPPSPDVLERGVGERQA